MALPIAILLCAEASAVPMNPPGPVDVSGTIMELKWVPAKWIEGIPGMSGSAAVDRIIPAHYLAATHVGHAGAAARLHGLWR